MVSVSASIITALIANAIVVGIQMELMEAKLMLAAVALEVAVEIVVGHFRAVTITQHKFANIAVLVFVRIYAAEFGHTLQLAHIFSAAVT